MSQEHEAGYRDAVAPPPPFEHTIRLPRTLMWLQIIPALLLGGFVYVLARSNELDVTCERTVAKTSTPPFSNITCTTSTLTKTRRDIPLPPDGHAEVVETRSGRSSWAYLVVNSKSHPETSVLVGPKEARSADDYRRIAASLNRMMEDPSSPSTMHETTRGLSFFRWLAVFLAVSGLLLGALVRAWRVTIRITRGASPAIEFTRVRFPLPRVDRRIEAGPNASFITEPHAANARLHHVVLKRANGTTDKLLVVGGLDSPKTQEFLQSLNDALKPP